MAGRLEFCGVVMLLPPAGTAEYDGACIECDSPEIRRIGITRALAGHGLLEFSEEANYSTH